MKLVKDLQKWIDGYNEVKTLADELELSFDFYKEELVTEGDVDTAYAKASEAVEALELKNMLRDEADQMACVLKINSGAGGTESQDWASMLMRMYLRYAETNGYKATIANLQEGDEAGIKTCTINIEGDFAYGYLKGENGVHRLVRVSPYNAQGKRMTSFASVFVNPLVDVYGFPRGQDLSEYATNFEKFDENRNMPVQSWFTTPSEWTQNPYWVKNRILNNNKRYRALASLTANLKATDWLNLQARGNWMTTFNVRTWVRN